MEKNSEISYLRERYESLMQFKHCKFCSTDDIRGVIVKFVDWVRRNINWFTANGIVILDYEEWKTEGYKNHKNFVDYIKSKYENLQEFLDNLISWIENEIVLEDIINVFETYVNVTINNETASDKDYLPEEENLSSYYCQECSCCYNFYDEVSRWHYYYCYDEDIYPYSSLKINDLDKSDYDYIGSSGRF